MSRISHRSGHAARAVPRPDDAPVDPGLTIGLGTVTSRRRVLALFGAGAGAAGLGAVIRGAGAFASTSPDDDASGSASAPATEIPEETAGPYPGDGSNGPDVLEQSGIVRRDITQSFGGATGIAEGVPVTLEYTVYDMANGGVPFEGVAVYAWHCTRDGRYSMYSEGVEDENFLRGVQVTDADGTVTFTTIFPGCYPGRWPHVHFEVFPDEASITDSTNAIATSQLAFPESVCDVVYAEEGYETSVGNLAGITLASDGIFSDDAAGAQLATVTGDVHDGFRVSLAVSIDTTTEAGGAPGGGPGGGGPGGGGPGGGPGGAPGDAPPAGPRPNG